MWEFAGGIESWRQLGDLLRLKNRGHRLERYCSHQRRALSSVQPSASVISASRRDSSRAVCGRAEGSLSRHDRISLSRAGGITWLALADGATGGVCTWCSRTPIDVSAV